MQPEAKTYVVLCKCGQVHSVRADEAGDERMCGRCSQSFKIPLILKTPEQLIESMIRFNQLPGNSDCPFTGKVATVTVDVSISEADADNGFLLSYLLFGFYWLMGYIVIRIRGDDPDDSPKPVIVVPLRIADEPEAYSRLSDKKDLIAALNTVPVYSHLLDRYDHVEVAVQRPHFGGIPSTRI